MTIEISVPYTDMVLACDSLQDSLEQAHGNTKIETIVNFMFKEGYNMDVFFYDYDFDKNCRVKQFKWKCQECEAGSCNFCSWNNCTCKHSENCYPL